MPRPFRLLDERHIATVRQVLKAHPGLSLRALCSHVRQACELPSMNVQTLHRFIEKHSLQRVKPNGPNPNQVRWVQGFAPPVQLPPTAGPSRAGLDLHQLWPTIITQENAA